MMLQYDVVWKPYAERAENSFFLLDYFKCYQLGSFTTNLSITGTYVEFTCGRFIFVVPLCGYAIF